MILFYIWNVWYIYIKSAELQWPLHTGEPISPRYYYQKIDMVTRPIVSTFGVYEYHKRPSFVTFYILCNCNGCLKSVKPVKPGKIQRIKFVSRKSWKTWKRQGILLKETIISVYSYLSLETMFSGNNFHYKRLSCKLPCKIVRECSKILSGKLGKAREE